jgi:hypothetical protein
MKLQQLISAGFAITAVAAASIPTVGWTLLGDAAVERPAVSVPASWEANPFLVADASLDRVVMQRSRTAERSADRSPPR